MAGRSEAEASEAPRRVNGITLDTGALIALERRKDRLLRALRAAREASLPITAPFARRRGVVARAFGCA
jgi:hypothetical protein